tara:strand:+ start:297 stop:2693 length:2397 start_codon:yes stop_codon:yes gene_type:complete
MRNNFLTYILIIFFGLTAFSYSEEIEITSKIIEFENEGNILIGKEDVVIKTKSGMIINADEVFYEKNKKYLKALGNIRVINKIKKVIIFSNEIEYFENTGQILSKGLTTAKLENKYFLKSNNLIYNTKKDLVNSKDRTEIDVDSENFINIDNFHLKINKKIISGENLEYFDNLSNKYYIKKGIYDLEKKVLLGKDVKGYFNKSSFGNINNDPRVAGLQIYDDSKKTTINKGIFTTCKKRDGCPPWTIKAEEVKHDKIKKTINYKNSWLSLYDVPILYFPKFFHPDPTVKRQSGFLAPRITSSNNFGLSFYLPYFKVLDDNKDLTFKPKFYEGENFILQNEYRQVGKNSNHIFDLSFGKSDINQEDSSKETKLHFFSNSRVNLNYDYFDSSILEVQLQKSSDESYLKAYEIQSPLISNNSTLNNSINFTGNWERSNLNLSASLYEDTTVSIGSDKYEYVYPAYSYFNSFEKDIFGSLDFSIQSSGFQRQYDTNSYEGKIVNNFTINKDLYSNYGFKNEIIALFKNVNSQNKVASQEEEKLKILGETLLKSSLPLKKETKKYKSILIPTLSLRYSPNKTANIANEDKTIDTENIFTVNRVGSNEIVEGGQSITIGNEYKLFNLNNRQLFNLNLATVLRDDINDDLPIKSSLNQKSSDLFGSAKINFTDNFNLNYKFSLDNNYKDVNYNFIEAEFSINNFITSFEFLEESKIRGGTSYLSNKTEYKFDDENSIIFSARENKLKNLTEFYDLIYQYKNDCLTASLQYKKEYYRDEDLKPNESLFFNITIVPFQNFQSKNFKD